MKGEDKLAHNSVAPAQSSTTTTAPTTNFEYDNETEWDVGIGDLIIDLDADIEKTTTGSSTSLPPPPPSPSSTSSVVPPPHSSISSASLSNNAGGGHIRAAATSSTALTGKISLPLSMAVEHSATVDKGLKMKIKRTQKPSGNKQHEIVKQSASSAATSSAGNASAACGTVENGSDSQGSGSNSSSSGTPNATSSSSSSSQNKKQNSSSGSGGSANSSSGSSHRKGDKKSLSSQNSQQQIQSSSSAAGATGVLPLVSSAVGVTPAHFNISSHCDKSMDMVGAGSAPGVLLGGPNAPGPPASSAAALINAINSASVPNLSSASMMSVNNSSSCNPHGDLQDSKKLNSEPKETADVCVGTSVATITEPECLGPCEPGTSVTLEGIVWHETEGVLVVNVTWRGKTYVGTLLDCTRHDWAPPRFCDSPTSDLDSRTTKNSSGGGRTSKRGRNLNSSHSNSSGGGASGGNSGAGSGSSGGGAGLNNNNGNNSSLGANNGGNGNVLGSGLGGYNDLSNFTETRSSVHSKLRSNSGGSSGGTSSKDWKDGGLSNNSNGHNSSSTNGGGAGGGNGGSNTGSGGGTSKESKSQRRSASHNSSNSNDKTGNSGGTSSSSPTPFVHPRPDNKRKAASSSNSSSSSSANNRDEKDGCGGNSTGSSSSSSSSSSSESSNKKWRHASSPPPSPVLLECPDPNCSKKYKHINGLRYHQSHAHGGGTNNEEEPNTTEQDAESTPDVDDSTSTTTSNTTVNATPGAPNSSNLIPSSPQIVDNVLSNEHVIRLGATDSGLQSGQQAPLGPLSSSSLPPTCGVSSSTSQASPLLSSSLPPGSGGPNMAAVTGSSSSSSSGPLGVGVAAASLAANAPPGFKIKSPASLLADVNMDASDSTPPLSSSSSSSIVPPHQMDLSGPVLGGLVTAASPPVVINSSHHHHHHQKKKRKHEEMSLSTAQSLTPGGVVENIGLHNQSRDDITSPAYSDISDDDTTKKVTPTATPIQTVATGVVGGEFNVFPQFYPSPGAGPPEGSGVQLPPPVVDKLDSKELMKKSLNMGVGSGGEPDSGGPGPPGGGPPPPATGAYYFPYGFPPGYPYGNVPMQAGGAPGGPSPTSVSSAGPPTSVGGGGPPSLPSALHPPSEQRSSLSASHSSGGDRSSGGLAGPTSSSSSLLDDKQQQHGTKLSSIQSSTGGGGPPGSANDLKDKSSGGPNENHQILKESIEVKNQMLLSGNYQQRHPSDRFYLYNSSTSEPVGGGVGVGLSPSSGLASSPLGRPRKDSGHGGPGGGKASSLKDIKKEEDAKDQGVKPTMETQGPPPAPTSQFAYIHASYMQPPYHAYDAGPHPMYRGAPLNPMHVLPGHYLHPSQLHARYPPTHAPEDLSTPNANKGIEMYYTTGPPSAHKIHELQERAMKSPNNSSSTLSKSSASSTGVGGPGSGGPPTNLSSPSSGPTSNDRLVSSNSVGGPGGGGGGVNASTPPSSASSNASSMGGGASGNSAGGTGGGGSSTGTPPHKDMSRGSPPPQRHVHTHHHTHVGLGYSILGGQFTAPYGATAVQAVINQYPPTTK